MTLWNDESRADARRRWRPSCGAAGLRVDVYPEADKLGKQFKYASSRNAPFVAILGDDERARGEVAVKDLRDAASRQSMPRDQVAALRRSEPRTENLEPVNEP